MKNRYYRLIEYLLVDIMEELPAVAIDGLKGVGKTESASTIAKTVFKLDNERDRLLLTNSMERLREAQGPVLLDEWQRLPAVWDYVRREVDRDRGRDAQRFILTGSASAKDLDVHSGAGRIVRLRMFPLSLEERGLDKKTVSLAAVFQQQESCVTPIEGETEVSFDRYMEEVTLSGLPGLRIEGERNRRLALGSYLDNLLTHDFAQEGILVRQPQVLKRWLTAYAAAIASTSGYNRILDSSTAGEAHKPAAKTATAYREALERLWMIDELPAWLDGEGYYSRLKKTAKHYLADPALAVQLLGISIDGLLGKNTRQLPQTRFDERYGNIIGRLFEALVFQSLRAYAASNGAELWYFHTEKGEREIDFIVTQGAQTVAIEVKATPFVDDRDVRHLVWLKNAMGDRLTDALILTTGPLAYRRPDGVAVVPAALFGA
jgi:predicted AAA+ superfamily ATPase